VRTAWYSPNLSVRARLTRVCFLLFLCLGLSVQNHLFKSVPPYTHPDFPLRILSSTQSLTGLIVVGESPLSNDTNHSIRYLRASHSIIGGAWLNSAPATTERTLILVDERDKYLGDSIYGTFVLQDATRLVNSTGKGKWEDALVM
jgi:hypothetical protein